MPPPTPALTAAGLVRRTLRPGLPARGTAGRRPFRGSLTAAATALTKTLRKTSGVGDRSSWQERAWQARDAVGELHYASDFFGHCVARVRLTIQRQNEAGEWEEVTDRSDAAVEALEALEGPRGTLAELQHAYGQQQFVAGESILFGYLDPDTGGEVWEMLSSGEVTRKDDGTLVRDPGGPEGKSEWRQVLAGQPLQPGEAIAFRLWDRHPRRSGEADSPMRGGVLELAEELILMGRAVRSRARNRASGPGILFVHDSITEPEPAEPGMDEDPDEDPFYSDLAKTISAARTDEESAAASIPLLIRLSPPDGVSIRDSVHLMQLTDPSVAYPETEREIHVVNRMAQALNLPPEVLTGYASVNHWGTWKIDDNIWSEHVQGPVERLCADVTSAYLRALIDDPDRRTRVWYDPSGLVTNPDRFADAQQAHDRMVISDEALRAAGGWDETDAPDDAERERRVAEKAGPAGPLSSPSTGGGDGASEEEEPPAPASATAAAARIGVARCREIAGARLLTRLQREPQSVQATAKGVPKGEVAHALGPQLVARLGGDPSALVAGGGDVLREAGFDGGLPARVEQHAARTLFDRVPAPIA